MGGGLRARVAGADVTVPVPGGGRVPYVNLDNAASTPPFHRALAALSELAPWYSNVHRGTGYKSRLSTWAFEEARRAVARFAGADEAHDVVLFTRNATEALNRVARRYPFEPGAVVVTTLMEHHSNDLPWRRVARVVRARVTADGRVDDDELRRLLRAHAGRVALLAVSGASNVTGVVNPVHTYARWAHEAGARIVVDAAQLAPHRPLEGRPAGDPEHLDFVAFSAHKMYAPFGVGVLIGPRDVLGSGEPDVVGGGAVTSVGVDHVLWADLPDREEAGTPCVTGAVALGAATAEYDAIGWPSILAQEARLARHVRNVLRAVPGLTIYGDSGGDQLGVVAFNLEPLPHGLLAALLAHEWGIGTRNGCFCAHPYVKTLLRISDAAVRDYEAALHEGDRSTLPGAVRVSVGLYNTTEEIDRLDLALRAIAAGDYPPDYTQDRATGVYGPAEWTDRFADVCRI